jgi:hypothetical protein
MNAHTASMAVIASAQEADGAAGGGVGCGH